MSRSPQLYPEDQQEIFVAIPPPLVPPLARQLSSSHHHQHHGIVNPQQLATPTTSTDNSFEQWTSFEPLLLQQQLLQQQQQQQQQQRALALLGGDRGSPGTTSTGGLGGSSSTGGQNRGLPPVPARSGSRTALDSNTSNASNTNNSNTTTNHASAERGGGGGIIPLNTPVSSLQQPPLPLSLPVQLLNRLYPFSAMPTTSSGGGSGGINPSVMTDSSSCASSSSAGSYHSRNIMSNMGMGSGVNMGGGFGSRSASSLMQQQPDMMARRNSTELARTAAATAIVNSLVSRGNSIGGGGGSGSSEAVGLSIPRGDSPYIPSSLSMLFSDPEIMQAQSEVDQLQQQQQQQRRMPSSQLTLSHSGSGVRSGIFAHSEEGGQESSRFPVEDHHDDDRVYGEESRLLQGITSSGADRLHTTTATGITGREEDDGGYGYEIVQEDQQEDVFRPYVAMMARDDYLAPHEPSSSSPLFPSPLTTLGGFASGTSMLDVVEAEQQAQAAGRIWRDYGTMTENGGGGGQGQFRHLQQLQNPTPSQSHAAYYHAVSNYHYSYNSNPHDDAGGREGGAGSSSSTSQVNPCVPTGHYAVPESWQWRRQRGREASHQSYGSAGGNGGSGSGTRRNNGDGSEDHWLWGILVSVVSCWMCCESPGACCTNCCL